MLRRLFTALLAVISIICFSACEKAAPIRLWHAYRGDEEKALAAILETWKGEPIEVLALPFDAFASKLSAAIPLGDGPDLFLDAHERLGEYRARRLVAPIDDALESRNVFAAPTLAAVEDGGVMW